MNLDFRLEHALNRYAGHHEVLDRVAVRIAESQVEVAAVVVAILVVGVVLRRWRVAVAAVLALGAAAVALIGNVIISDIWARQRPFVAHPHTVRLLTHHAPDAGFPSDHAAALAAIATAFILVIRWIGILAWTWAVLVGLARIYVGEHYPGDILGGLVLGVAAAFIVFWVARKVVPFVPRLPSAAREALVVRSG